MAANERLSVPHRCAADLERGPGPRRVRRGVAILRLSVLNHSQILATCLYRASSFARAGTRGMARTGDAVVSNDVSNWPGNPRWLSQSRRNHNPRVGLESLLR